MNNFYTINKYWLLNARKAKKIKMEDMAAALSVSGPTYSNYENNPELMSVHDMRICMNLLDIAIDQIFINKATVLKSQAGR